MILVVKSINRSNFFIIARFIYRNIPDVVGDLDASVQILMVLSLNSEWLLTVCSKHVEGLLTSVYSATT